MMSLLSDRKQMIRLGLGWLVILMMCNVVRGQTYSLLENPTPCVKHLKIDRGEAPPTSQSVTFSVKYSNGTDDGPVSGTWVAGVQFYRIETNRLNNGYVGTVTLVMSINEVPQTARQFTFDSSCSPGGNSGTRMVMDEPNGDIKKLWGTLQVTLKSVAATQVGKVVSVSACPASVKLEGKLFGLPDMAGKTVYYTLVAHNSPNGGSLTPNSPLPKKFSLTFPVISTSGTGGVGGVSNARVGGVKTEDKAIETTFWTLTPTSRNKPAIGWLELRLLNAVGGLTPGPLDLVKVRCDNVATGGLPAGPKVRASSDEQAKQKKGKKS